MVFQATFTISDVNQWLQLQKLYRDFLDNAIRLNRKFDLENKSIKKEGLERVYLNFFVMPIVDITEDS